MYGARKNLISFDDISLRIPRLSASNLNIRRVIEKKTFGTALRKLLMVIASSLAIYYRTNKQNILNGSGVLNIIQNASDTNRRILYLNDIDSYHLFRATFLIQTLEFKYRTEAETVLILISNEISQRFY